MQRKLIKKQPDTISVIDHENCNEVSETVDKYFVTSSYKKVINLFGQSK